MNQVTIANQAARSRLNRPGAVHDASVDGAQIDVERPGQAFLAHAPVDGSADHVVFGDGGQSRLPQSKSHLFLMAHC